MTKFHLSGTACRPMPLTVNFFKSMSTRGVGEGVMLTRYRSKDLFKNVPETIYKIFIIKEKSLKDILTVSVHYVSYRNELIQSVKINISNLYSKDETNNNNNTWTVGKTDMTFDEFFPVFG